MFCRIKTNVKNEGGARLNNNFELFTIGFNSSDATRTMEQYNFLPTESRNNVVEADAVLQKFKHSEDENVINVYQKPRELLDWMVGNFSKPKDWVLDLCCGSGTGLAACMAYIRHCASVEIDLRQSKVLQKRVLNLENKEDNIMRIASFYGELSLQERRSEAEDLFVRVGASGGVEASSSQ
jgi:DNA modification methylase